MSFQPEAPTLRDAPHSLRGSFARRMVALCVVATLTALAASFAAFQW